jgi:hypothetical protein
MTTAVLLQHRPEPALRPTEIGALAFDPAAFAAARRAGDIGKTPGLAAVLGQAANGIDPPKLAPATMPGGPQAKVHPVLRALVPAAIVLGESHGQVVGRLFQGGNFTLINPTNGARNTFHSQLLTPLPPIPSPWGPINQGISLVGTTNRPSEGGLGYSAKVPTPIGDMLVFANARGQTRNAWDALVRGERDGTASINLGLAFSATDGAATALGGMLPPPAGPALMAAIRSLPVDGWIGVAYRASATFEGGQLRSLKIGDVELPLDRLGSLFGR